VDGFIKIKRYRMQNSFNQM